MPNIKKSSSNNMPNVSVIMTVYNAERYIKKSIDSILTQSYSDFEFIIIDDGSTDRSASIIREYDDTRIIFISRRNKGQTKSLNEAIKIAKGKYIARQDADDISDKDRLKLQVKFMQENKDIGLLGTNYKVIYPDGKLWFDAIMFTNPDDLQLAIIFSNQFGHGTIMARKDLVEQAGGYNPKYKITQDHDLWARMAHFTRTANINQFLYKWTYYPESLSSGSQDITSSEALEIRRREFRYYMKNRKKYKKISIHPTSIDAGVRRYFEMKNSLYRNMAIMYCDAGFRRHAIPSLILGVIFAPWQRQTYRYIWIIIFQKKLISSLVYDTYIH